MDPVTATTVDGLNLFGMLGQVLWYLLRIGAALQAMPMIGGRGMPMRARMIIAIALSAAISTVMPAAPIAAVDATTVLTVVREMAVGLSIGLVLRLAFEAGQLAGELISQGMALSFATLADPLSGASSTVLSQWFFLIFGLLFFTLDGHLALVGLLADSYQTLPIGAPLLDVGDFLAALPAFFASCLRTGLLLALPVMMALLASNLAFGVLSRAAAALNPIAIGLPVSLLVGMTLMTLLARELQVPVQRLFEDAFLAARALTG